uniref:F-box protein 43 n=1 Tax=Lates calcarifer TaxID=8187 RepID=A0A4W6EYX4_LATCA
YRSHPRSISGVDSCRSLSPVEFNEMPKENLRLSVTPKERTRESPRLLDKDSRGSQRPSVTWCETPKVYKRDAPLRLRLLMCKPSTESSIGTRSEDWLSASLGSPDTVMGALASNTLKQEQDLPLSGRKRRLLFSQVRTSTLEDGKLHSELASNFERRISLSGDDFSESISASDQINIETPCFRKFLPASSKENSQSPINSGFSSLTLDKSQDSSVDHDGSFQEVLLFASKRNCETPNLAEAKRRSRLHRQHRLSTLREGGSQSEEDPKDRQHEQYHQCHSHSKEDVFSDGATPRNVLSLKCENMTPFINLSLTPALQLVHAMCQQMSFGQSPSLMEQLKSTAALAETPLAFRTTMPLAGLIGRKMGLGKVDILTELKKRNLRHILAVIFSHLTSDSIYRCGQVSKSWNGIIQQDKQASFRRRNHLSEVKAALELGAAVHVPDAETRLTLLKRSALKTVQTHSHKTFTLFHISFSPFQVAKTLFNDECLKPCPRCQHPARCHSVKGEGVCSRADCGFQFCTSCLCAFHGSRECGSQSVGRRKNDILLPGSAQSKRNVRRL